MHVIPGLSPRAAEEAGILSVDDADMGEFAYDLLALSKKSATLPAEGQKAQCQVQRPNTKSIAPPTPWCPRAESCVHVHTLAFNGKGPCLGLSSPIAQFDHAPSQSTPC